jgi:polysaccharide biosynthesis protein PelG
MAGVGFVLRRLVRADGLSTNLGGLGHATMASSGPWLLTCAVLIAIGQMGRADIDLHVLSQFSIIVTYNFSFSLVGCGAVVMVVTRRLADAIYSRDASDIPDLLVGSLLIVFMLMSIIGVSVYGFASELKPHERILGFVALLLTGGIWLAAAYMSALKSYASITTSFAFGMATALVAALVMGKAHGLAGLLAGYTAGLAVVFFSLAARITIDFPGHIRHPFSFLLGSRHLWQLAVVGLTMNAAIWVDKWVMWFSPGAIAVGRAMLTHESYESAMFLAYLSIVPSMALLFMDIETGFFESYLKYFRQISQHATLMQIRTQQSDLKRLLIQGLKRIALLQTTVCLVGLLLAPALVSAVGGGLEMIPILRYGLVGALFHMLLIAVLIVFAYFDLRRELLLVSVIFFALNAGLTATTVWRGAEYYGYGYCLAALGSFGVAFYFAGVRVNQLLYQTFLANNQAIWARPQ